MSLTSGMFMPLRAMGSQYNQAKADGKVDLFIALAREALWKADPPDIAIRTDSYTVRAFEKAIQKKLEAISLVNQYAPCPQWEAIMWLSAGVGLSGETTDCEDSQSTISEPAEGETTHSEDFQSTTNGPANSASDGEALDSDLDSDDAVIITPGVRSNKRKIRILHGKITYLTPKNDSS